eukprot:6485759-Amphidinium_carterae.1
MDITSVYKRHDHCTLISKETGLGSDMKGNEAGILWGKLFLSRGLPSWEPARPLLPGSVN